MKPDLVNTSYSALRSAIDKYFINFILPGYILFIVLNTQINSNMATVSIAGFITGLLILISMVSVAMIFGSNPKLQDIFSYIEEESAVPS